MSDESRLISDLTDRYHVIGKTSRPTRNASRVLIIEFALALIQILDFDETNQVLATNVWKRYVSFEIRNLFIGNAFQMGSY